MADLGPADVVASPAQLDIGAPTYLSYFGGADNPLPLGASTPTPVTFTVAMSSETLISITFSADVANTFEMFDFTKYTITSPGVAEQLVITAVTRVSSVLYRLTVTGIPKSAGAYTLTLAAATTTGIVGGAVIATPVAFTAPAVTVVISSVVVLSSTVLQVNFSRDMRTSSPGSALGLSNYTLTRVSGAVNVPVSAVVQKTARQFELTTTAMNSAVSHTISTTATDKGTNTPGNTITFTSFDFTTNPGTLVDPGNVIGDSVLVPAEWRMRRPFKYPTLEFFRQQMLEAVSSSPYAGSRGRSVLFFTQDTDVRGIFIDLFGVEFKTPEARLVLKRPALDVYEAVGPRLNQLQAMALSELRQAKVPEAYTTMLEPRLTNHNYVDRVSAYAAVVLLAATVLE